MPRHAAKTVPALHVFGATVQTRRKQLGLTQRDLAAKTGLHYTYIGDIERGERNVSLLNILRLAAALELPPSDLLQPLNTQPALWPSPRKEGAS